MVTDENVRKWRKATPIFQSWTVEGQSVEGRLVQKSFVEFKHGEIMVSVGKYTLEGPEGSVSFMGGVSLDALLAPIAEGTEIRVVYLGKQTTSKGMHVNTFDLYVAD